MQNDCAIENACHSERSAESTKSKKLRAEGQRCKNDTAKSPVAVPSECPRSFDLRPSLTAATRSGRSSRHWRRSHRSPSTRLCLAQDDRGCGKPAIINFNYYPLSHADRVTALPKGEPRPHPTLRGNRGCGRRAIRESPLRGERKVLVGFQDGAIYNL